MSPAPPLERANLSRCPRVSPSSQPSGAQGDLPPAPTDVQGHLPPVNTFGRVLGLNDEYIDVALDDGSLAISYLKLDVPHPYIAGELVTDLVVGDCISKTMKFVVAREPETETEPDWGGEGTASAEVTARRGSKGERSAEA